MALVLKDRVNETTTTTGTGTVTLAGAVSGYQSFSVIGNANTTYYTITHQTANEWEVGVGTYTLAGTLLSRDTVLSSSNSGSLVSFSAGTKFVFCDYPATQALYKDASGNSIALGTPASGTVTNLTGTASININGTVGATTPATASVTTLTASADSSFTSTGALLISKGTTAQRTAGTAGQLRFNTTSTEFEGYNGTAWASVGGAALSNDTTTATNLFPLFVSATSGTASTLNTSNAKLLYKPSTGELQASAMVSSNGITVNSTTVSANYTIASGYNGFSVGPITISSGIAVTVSSGQTWVVV